MKLRLDQIQSEQLEGNPLFTQLRGKLVGFYRRWEVYRDTGNPATMLKTTGLTEAEVRDMIQLKKRLKDSLKRLLRVVIVTHDPYMQEDHLKRLH